MSPGQPSTAAWTLVELMVAVTIGSILLMALGSFVLYGGKTFAAMANYSDFETKNRVAMDLLSRELRGATMVTSLKTNDGIVTLRCSNSVSRTSCRLVWDQDARTLVLGTANGARELLHDCVDCRFKLYSRAPLITSTGFVFTPALGTADCKVLGLSWRCARTVLGKMETDSAENLQIALRNDLK